MQSSAVLHWVECHRCDALIGKKCRSWQYGATPRYLPSSLASSLHRSGGCLKPSGLFAYLQLSYIIHKVPDGYNYCDYHCPSGSQL
ncbi:hypothetical protein BO83DRAFT_133292 [Aspergillus eucalypticola CBS 122712]|uniref:Uncharacterized protein n=1 Tax=Aspergillus eucalypticola (strain CBS 122712 / IBT 29274) TaxID=1448314 RepID=A0A317W8X4_ASPEC|nr:uncharacterized protein BO83DRAFT_133292 [Aspergillus eucalypticola CBS 122712]PWY82599.1 hypothetical protein BO83DRAFT_133292 [Aspergillus eucalypticola CBS 122712]